MTDHTPSAEAAAVLGFGCGSLGSVTGYKGGCKLVELAFDAGFRRFDVAPPYGNGAAERILGDVLGTVRDQVVLVSKVGFAHPKGGNLVNTLRRIASPLKRALPGLWGHAAQHTRKLLAPAGTFTPVEVATSLAETLKRLRTDWLDILLLHEAAADALNDAAVATLLDVQRQGLVRSLGTGTSLSATLALQARYPKWFGWAQVTHWPDAFEPSLRRSGLRLSTHGCLRSVGNVLLSLAADQSPDACALRQALADPATRVPLLLRAALAHVGPGGVVVVSTTQRRHVQALAGAERVAVAPLLIRVLNESLARGTQRQGLQ